MSIQSDVPEEIRDLEEPQARETLDAPLTGVAGEPELPAWAQVGRPPRWPRSWKMTPEKLRSYFGPDVYNSVKPPDVAIDSIFVLPTGQNPTEEWAGYVLRMERAAANSLAPHNLITEGSLQGGGPIAEVRCTACQKPGMVLMNGACWEACDD